MLPYLYGHIHKDMVIERDGIKAVASDCLLSSVQEDGTRSSNFDNQNVKIRGGWDCILIDKKERILRKRRFGVPEADLDIQY